MTQRLIHYSVKPVELLKPMQPGTRHNGKPAGLWVSVEGEDDWRAWCEGEHWNLEALAFEHEVTLSASATILRLRDSRDIDRFCERYAEPAPRRERLTIAWPAVAKEYQGIIIAPYCWERRLSDHCLWYYGWDCASGCIWDVAAIERLVCRPAERAPSCPA